MKKSLLVLAALTAFGVLPTIGQAADQSPAPATETQPGALTRFDLDFPGGTPAQLVAAIQKASGRPLNAIIPDEFATTQLPPLKMQKINVAQLFEALRQASPIRSIVPAGLNNFTYSNREYGFSTAAKNPTDESIWFFYVRTDMPYASVPTTRFYLLTPYIDSGLTVDDITTAIQTGWRMRGSAEVPKLSFHKETKLLIATGAIDGLDVIDAALKALNSGKAKPAPLPAEAPKTETKP